MSLETICKWNYNNEGQIWSIDYDASLSLEQGWALWMGGEGHLASLSGGSCQWGTIVDGPHWGIVLVGRGGTGNNGRAILVPRCAAARRLVRAATIERWSTAHGFSREQAEALFELPLRFKHELAGSIAAALKDPIMVRAAADWPGVGPGLHGPWANYWTGAYKRHLAGLPSWGRRETLIEAVRAMS